MPFCLGAVPLIFDTDEVNDALLALIPNISIAPGSTQFGGCSDDEVQTLTNTWNAIMDSVIPDAQTALSQPVGSFSQVDNIFNALFGFTTDQGIDFPTRTDIINKYDQMLAQDSASPPVNIFFHCTDKFFETLNAHKIDNNGFDAGDICSTTLGKASTV